MMNSRYERHIYQLGAVLAVLLLQVGEVYLNSKFKDQLQYLDLGIGTLSIGLLTVILGIMGGVILALVLLPKRQDSLHRKRLLLETLILSAVPALAIALKLLSAVGVTLFSPLRPLSYEIWEWAVYSQVPPLWLGLVIGWLARNSLIVQGAP